MKNLVKLFLRTSVGRPIREQFTAGETIEEGVAKAEELRSQGFKTTLAYAGGEQLSHPNEIERVIEMHELMLEKASELPFSCDIAIKYSQFGLFSNLEPWLHLRYLNWLQGFIKEARKKGVFIWIDAEELEFREKALEITCYASSQNYHKDGMPGICIQAYAKDSLFFLIKILKLGLSVRICNGAYKESAEKIVTEKDQLQSNFCFLLLASGCGNICLPRIQIATHNDYLRRVTKRTHPYPHHLKTGRAEFGSLLGRHKEKGENIYIIFGPDTDDFLARRFMEYPWKCFLMLFKTKFKK